MRFGIIAIVLTLVLGGYAPARAQQADTAVLVADKVFMNGSNVLVAEGTVEVLQGDIRMRASRIVYDRRNETLTVEGPITITEGDDIVVLANAAELDAGLKNGILTGARMVLQQQVQLAAHQLNRVNGRYSQLYKAAVTSCRVCQDGSPPLWQIRAQRVIHDQQERQLYFDRAQLRVLDLPILYVPRLRLPDPTLKRARGFLIPSIRSNSDLGTGFRVPYFIPIGDHRDLTVTPFIATNTTTLELRYRQAFRRGNVIFSGAISRDSLLSGETRSYLFGEGNFDLDRGFKLRFNLEQASDDAYLVDYDYSDKDRLDSEIEISRARRDEFISAALVHHHSLRDNEDNSTLPSVIADFQYERRFFPRATGGELRLSAEIHGHYRSSDLAFDSGDADTIVDGRDVARLSAAIDWRRSWTAWGGLRVGVLGALAVDSFSINQDVTSVAAATTATPQAAVWLRWPWQKATAQGTVHVVEPIAQISWVGGNDPDIANDESTRVEFDEGNLLSLSRFPSEDRRERGVFAAYGASWRMYGPNGWQAGLTAGQVVREDPNPGFSDTSGLGEKSSDILLAGQLKTPQGISLTARGLLDSRFDLNKVETRAGWQNQNLALGASYVWLGADLAEDRPDRVSEWSLDGFYRISRHWTAKGNWRYDLADNRTAEAGIGLEYRNECVVANLSLSRRFTSSTILTPATDISFTVGLGGFTARTADSSYTRTCRN